MKMNHLSFPTKNAAQEAQFLADHFGAKIEHIHEASGSVLLRHGDIDIVLDAQTSEVPWHSDFHFGFELDTKREVDELYARFQKAGVKIETEVFNRIGRGSRFFGRTPGGIQFEVNTREDAEEKFKQRS